MEQYYYNHMSAGEQNVYYTILRGLSDLEDEFLVARCEPEALYNIFFRLRLDHPEIFWATGYKYKYYLPIRSTHVGQSKLGYEV